MSTLFSPSHAIKALREMPSSEVYSYHNDFNYNLCFKIIWAATRTPMSVQRDSFFSSPCCHDIKGPLSIQDLEAPSSIPHFLHPQAE